MLPLLLPDAPVVAWWPAAAPAVPADDPVGRLANRRITDAAAAKPTQAALVARAESYQPGDTDLAWSRVTGWRACWQLRWTNHPFDRVTAARSTGASDSPSADLLAAWLALTLRVPGDARQGDRCGRRGQRSARPPFGTARAGPPWRRQRDLVRAGPP